LLPPVTTANFKASVPRGGPPLDWAEVNDGPLAIIRKALPSWQHLAALRQPTSEHLVDVVAKVTDQASLEAMDLSNDAMPTRVVPWPFRDRCEWFELEAKLPA